MIKIGKPFIEMADSKAYLKAKVEVSADTAEKYMALRKDMRGAHWRTDKDYPPKSWTEGDSCMWFSVQEEYGKYICAERADAFVVAMLWYAMMTGSDIECEGTISERLLFSVNSYLIPALCREDNGYTRIKVKAPASNEPIENIGGVGTGMSCGVDSLYTLRRYMEEDVPQSYRLTHLVYSNMGAIFHPDSTTNTDYGIEEFYKITDEMSEKKFENAVGVGNMAGLPVIYICSNLDKDYYRGGYAYTGLYRNFACTLALQKLFDKYYCSSTGCGDSGNYSLTGGSALYQSLLCNCTSTENCSFIVSDYVMRIEKTKALSGWDIAEQYLDVCFNFNNCGHCDKCYRTLITLDVLGGLEGFKPVFDIEAYKKNRPKAFGWLLSNKSSLNGDNELFTIPLLELMKEKNIKIPAKAYPYYVKNMIIKFLVKAKRTVYKILKLR